MLVSEYVAALHELVTTTPFVTATTSSYEERPPSTGLIKGGLTFADGSHLEFKEFVITQPTLSVVKYGYHYRRGDRLIFRYDNASDPAARNLSTFPHHRHDPSGLLPGTQPSLKLVLQEILSQLKSP